jgi:hypothetical protein
VHTTPYLQRPQLCRTSCCQCLQDHIAAPASNNVLANIGDYVQHTPTGGQVGFVLWLAAGFAAGALYKRAQDGEEAAAAAGVLAPVQQQDVGNTGGANASTK